jgi:hypothetical protein
MVDELTLDGSVIKEKEGRRNRYQVQFDAPLNEGLGRQRTVGELLRFLVGPQKSRKAPSRPT